MREIRGTKHGMAADFWIVRGVKAMSTPDQSQKFIEWQRLLIW